MIVTEHELQGIDTEATDQHIRLVMRITKGELTSILRPRMQQLTLEIDQNFEPVVDK